MAIVNGYCTLAQLRSEIGNYTVSDTDDDAKLELSIEAASRQIDGYCGRRFWQDATVKTREYEADSSRLCFVDDISTTTGLIVKIDDAANGTFGTTVTIATDFILRPANAEDDTPARPYTEIWLADNYTFPYCSNGRPSVQVTAKFGWAAVPDDVEKACLIQAAQLFKAKDAPFGVAFGVGFEGAGSSALRVWSKINPIAETLLMPYRKPAIG
jgi:hypothetical protein